MPITTHVPKKFYSGFPRSLSSTWKMYKILSAWFAKLKKYADNNIIVRPDYLFIPFRENLKLLSYEDMDILEMKHRGKVL